MATSPSYGITLATLTATSTIDEQDTIDFLCKNPTINSLQLGMPAMNMTASLDLTCTKVVTAPGGLVGLIVAIAQGAVLCILGPAIMIYGPTVPRFTALIQAVIVSSYILLINSIVSINAFTAFLVFERFVTLVISTLTVTYTSVNNPGAKAKAAGFALGTLIATPLMQFLSEQLYKVIGCTGFGDSTEYFPNGTPQGCDIDSASFQGIFQGTLFARWLIIVGSAYFGKKTINFSTSTAGATMFVKGLIDLIKAVGFQLVAAGSLDVTAVTTVVSVLTPVRTWVTYGVAIVGFLFQRLVLEAKTEGEGEKAKTIMVQKAKQPLVFKVLCSCLINRILAVVDRFLQRNLEALTKEGALTRALTRTPTKKKADEESTTKDNAKKAEAIADKPKDVALEA